MGRALHPTTAKLREFHKLGKTLARDARKLGASRGDRYGNVKPLLSEHAEYAESYLYCARKFAELYPTGAELSWFCGLHKSVSTANGQSETKSKSRPLGPSHVMQLLSVDDAKERYKLAKQCAKEGWSVMRLRQELAKTRDVRHWKKSRQVRKDFDPMQAVVELQFLAERWNRWISVSKATDKDVREGETVYDRLPKTVRSALEQVQSSLVALTAALGQTPPSKQRSKKPPGRRKGAGSAKRSSGHGTS